MATLIKIWQASLPGGWLLVISAPSIERSPAVDSRGSEAAITPSGVAEECGCQSHVLNAAVMTVVGLSGLEGWGGGVVERELVRTSPHGNDIFQNSNCLQLVLCGNCSYIEKQEVKKSHF